MKKNPAFPNKKEVYELVGISTREAQRLIALYRMTQVQPGEEAEKLILRYAKSHSFTPQQVLSIRNQTVRKDAMEAYGLEALIKKGGGKEIQSDDFGTLWQLDFREGRDTFARFVEVVNTTPEPDGHHARYFLRVPPRTKTAREAVAWIGSFERGRAEEFSGFAAQS